MHSCRTIDIVVGCATSSDNGCQSHTRKLPVLESVLIGRSPFFANVVHRYRSPSSEPSGKDVSGSKVRPGSVRLPEDNPKVVNNYVLLLHSEEAPTLKKPDDLEEVDTEEYPRVAARILQTAMCTAVDDLQTQHSKLYLFCEKMQDVTSKEIILAAIIKSTKTPIKDLQRRARSGPSIINRLCAVTKTGGRIRRWLSDCALCFEHSGWLQDGLGCHPEYLQDVVRGMWKCFSSK
ncbi:uncharacterized protein M421DRAFT_92141 [Didymella exigua CBS 183.55]|uniref:BTB domain-containing protein n=1 Tax=Didymella exigua CBS 183.55 TaxID=1150837 RepID=A0A6A5RPR0_9PLEO|nr:uncharacterized protein M421DRAFT_92141 [Didymella exigua CBS 183.55]KAF1929034.1 hypothetical protein M421DRAFT_92141 [Didymella exigua CBS 183.55]